MKIKVKKKDADSLERMREMSFSYDLTIPAWEITWGGEMLSS
jgi:hypothetical protein